MAKKKTTTKKKKKSKAKKPATKKSKSAGSAATPKDQDLLDAIENHIPRGVLPEREKSRKKITSVGPQYPTISVKVNDGYVMLSGTVWTARQKDRLHRFVMGLPGVRALKDELDVCPEDAPGDRDIARLVRGALDAHAELPLGTITVHVHKGLCFLRGYVESAEQKHVAEHVAEHCRGVKTVVNEIDVDQFDRFSDQATADAVRGAFDYCAELNSKYMTVSCADGVVLLRGEAPTLFDRALAEELARIQGGVRHVENRLEVIVGMDRRKTDGTVKPVETGPRKKQSKKKRSSGVQGKRKIPLRD